MRSSPKLVPLIAFSLLSVCATPLAAQQRTPPPSPSQPNMGTAPARVFSVHGMVSDAASHARLDLVKLELRSVNGAVVGTVFTTTNGTFEFSTVSPDTYTLVADFPGYQTASEQVEVFNSSVYGVQVELVKSADGSAPVSKGPGTVSVRELSIPQKAHDGMKNGMVLLYGKSDYAGSLKAFEKATREYADYYEAYTQMGVAYMKLNDAANAEKAFRKSIEVSHERYVDAYVGLCDLFQGAHRAAEAEPLARKAVEIDPDSWQANSELARTLVELQRYSEGEPSALAAVKLKPDNPTLYLVLANIHMQLQNNGALLDDLNHYLKLAPDGAFAEQARRQRDAIAALQSAPAASTTSQP